MLRLWVWESLKTLFYVISASSFLLYLYRICKPCVLVNISCHILLSLMLLYHVFCCENILWTWLNKWVRQCRASTIQSGSVCFELSLSVLHHVYICDTGSCTPSAGMDVGGGPYLHLKCEYWLLMSIWNSNPIHIFRGGSYTHDSKNLKLYFISFVSSNWVVINHQKGEDCKCNQPFEGFGDWMTKNLKGLTFCLSMCVVLKYLMKCSLMWESKINMKCLRKYQLSRLWRENEAT